MQKPVEKKSIFYQSPVANPKRKWYGAVVIAVFSVLILASIWMQSSQPKKTTTEKTIVTASQVDVRRSMITENMENNKQQELSADKIITEKNNKLIDKIGEKIPLKNAEKQQQLVAAQKRLLAPSQVYVAAESGENSTSNSNQLLGDPNDRFANAMANQSINTMTASQQEITDYKIFQGKVIPAVLDTAINSDLPGMIRATISEDVYGETGREVLLPRGSRLIGQYNAAVKVGQVRVYAIWTRVITPQQIDIRLASPGVDTLGRAGFSGNVDNHFWEIFGTSLLLSIMAAGVSDIETENSDQLYGNPYQFEVVESFSDNSDAILSRNLEIKPTITIDQGEPIRVMVAQDLDFSQLPISHAMGNL